MAQQTPVRPPQPRPKIVRTPYGWDCKMDDEPSSVIPAWDEPLDDGHRRRLMTWALVPLAIAVVAVAVIRPTFLGGTPTPRQTPSGPVQVTQGPPAATLGATSSPPPTRAPTATPVPTRAPSQAPTVAPPAPPVVHVTGFFPASGPSTCNGAGTTTPNPSAICQWGVTAAAGSTVTYTVTWPEATPLRLTVYGPPPTTTQLATKEGMGTLTVTVPNSPAKTVAIVSGAGGPATFDLQITVKQ